MDTIDRVHWHDGDGRLRVREFTITSPNIPESAAGIPLRPVVSVLAVAGFVGPDLVGARATGSTEDALVAANILILLAFGLGGIHYQADQQHVTLAV